MALTDESTGNGFYMPVAPAYGGYGNQGGFFGGDWAWIILLLLIGGGGWGFGGLGGGMMWPMMMGGMGGFGIDYLYPWLNNSQHISDGFRDQNLQTSIGALQNSVTAGFGDVQNSLCSGFANVTGAINNGFSAAEIAANGRQIANLQQGFGIQSAIQGGFAQNAAGTADLKYTIATEACADRAAVTAGIQTVLDKLCQLELDNYKSQLENKNDTIAQLRSDLQYARGQASQDVQTARILAGQTAEVDALYNRLSNCPVPSTPVYGRQPIFTCNGGCNGSCSGYGFAA